MRRKFSHGVYVGPEEDLKGFTALLLPGRPGHVRARFDDLELGEWAYSWHELPLDHVVGVTRLQLLALTLPLIYHQEHYGWRTITKWRVIVDGNAKDVSAAVRSLVRKKLLVQQDPKHQALVKNPDIFGVPTSASV